MPRAAAPRRALTRVRESLRSARYLLKGAFFAVGRVLRAAGRGVRAFWVSLNVYTRRLAVALAAVGALALIWLVAVPALPCQLPGGDECPPSDDAIELVPGDALAYLHLNLDRGGDQYEHASDVAAQVPTLAQLTVGSLLSRIPGPHARPVDFERDVAPWFGDEAALALIPGSGGAAQEVQMLEASDKGGARAFARSIAGGRVEGSGYRGVDVRVDSGGVATAQVAGFLVIGTEPAVRAVIDAAHGGRGARSLADSSRADAARDALPGDRFADAYISPDGIGELVSHPGGLLSQFSPFVDPDASLGVAAALSAGDDGIRLCLRSALDPRRARSNPGFFSAFKPFDPSLAEDLPADSLAYVGVGDPGQALRSLLGQATAEQPGLADAFTNLVQRVDSVGGVDLKKDLVPSLGREVAFAVEPAPRHGGGGAGETEKLPHVAPPPTPGGAPAPQDAGGALTQPGAPFLLFVGSGVDEDAAKAALARLEAPIASALNPASQLGTPSFSGRRVGDVEAQALRLSPTVELTYAVLGGLLVVASDPEGVAQIATGDGGLADSDAFARATQGFPGEPSVLAYLNLGGLVSLAEDAGLAADPAYATFAQDIRRLAAVGLAVESRANMLSTDVRVVLGPGQPASPSGVPAPTD